jgi:hypothetical protein
MPDRFRVVEYGPESLARLIAERPNRPSDFSSDRFSGKLHLEYFREYFKILGARSIVVENDYVDRDFLEDFASYYVRCFQSYARKCSRLHFFDTPISEESFRNLLSATESDLTPELLQAHYLGFIVIKPLPETIIGRSCVKAYPDADGRRSFPAIRRYRTNLFGIELSVDSLAFQEQDTVAAACATSTLWSIFQGTGELFHHTIPSPVEITKAATAHSPVLSRVFPNKDGLTGEQMAHAITNVGLEPLLAGFADETTLKAAMYAYLRARIPLAFVIALVDVATGIENGLGLHAVAVTGYSLAQTDPAPSQEDTFRLRATRIDKIYVHDDQVGPFARMTFQRTPLPLRMRPEGPEFCLSTSWKSGAGAGGEVIAIPHLLLVPLYHKVRIPFEVVHDHVFRFHQFLDLLRANGVLPQSVPTDIEWDIFLTTVNEVKSSLLRGDGLSGEDRVGILTEEMPRFLWRATLIGEGAVLIDLLFDATDIEQGGFFIRAIEHDAALSATLRSVTRVPEIVEHFGTTPEWCILNWFGRQQELS